MTSRERWLAVLAGEKPDRIPTDIWATPETHRKLQRALGCRDEREVWKKLHIDAAVGVQPPRKVSSHPDDAKADIWGIRYRSVAYADGAGVYRECENHPLAHVRNAAEVHAFRWPRPEDCDFAAIPCLLDALPRDHVVFCGGYEPFLLYCYLRGMEQAMVDLVENEEIAEAILGHLFDYHYRVNERVCEAARGRADVFGMGEDLGAQDSLLMGLRQIRRYFLPNQKRMADMARSYGLRIFYHSDGAIRAVLPDLIAVTGIDILNPVQWRCPGMEREGLVREFGRRVVFHGAVDNQQTLPFGTPAEVRREVLDSIAIFRDARWICAPCHTLQPTTPVENIVALYETIHEHGRSGPS